VSLRRSRLAAAAPRHERRAAAIAARLAAARRVEEEEAPPAPTALARLQSRLFEPRPARPTEAPDGVPLDDTVTVLAAAGESLEAVEIARIVRRAIAAGVRPRQVAVLLHDQAPYAAHLASAFERAGIEAFFVEGVPRVDPAAVGLGLLLALVGGDLDRRAVMELLTTAQVSWGAALPKDAPISPARWDRLSAEAGIVSGLASWRERLDRARAAALGRAPSRTTSGSSTACGR
jgi:hypothetical protein